MRFGSLVFVLSTLVAACDGTDAPGLDPAAPADAAQPTPDGAAPDGTVPDGATADQGPSLDQGVPADQGPAPDGGTVDQGPLPDLGPLPAFPARVCEVTVTVEAPGAGLVQLAGDFTGWADRPLVMDRAGDGRFSLTLGEAAGLVPGTVHAYKVIVDGQWRIHGDAPYRKYDGDCVNSGLKLPDCSRPDLEVRSLAVDAAGDGALVFAPQTGADGTPIDTIEVALDGAPVAVTVDGDRVRVPVQGLAAGKHRFTVTLTDEAGAQAGPTHLPFWVEDTAFDWRDSVLYLLFLDRFANGDASNDGTIGDPVAYAADWHGGDLQGALAVLESGYFERLGVRSIWLSPINAQIDGHWADRGDGRQRYASYHGYWPVRGREIDARYGGNEGLRAFIDAAHARGIRVLLDLINN
ncbi:MAG: hypothetical protein KC613_22100, partial [Myxococcales bacterium]|nr:hypothetical protein [Myxococcales bacterium]